MSKRKVIDQKCQLCKTEEKEICGELLIDKKTSFKCHLYCLLFASGLPQKGSDIQGLHGFLVDDIKRECSRASRLRCTFCRRTSASIGCSVGSCRMSCHYQCGKANGVLNQFSGNFSSYCRSHAPRPKVKRSLLKGVQTCYACMEKVAPPFEGCLSPPCCRFYVLHKDCLQKQAIASGAYFFRCPMCNDIDTFKEFAQSNGIYVPERDAQWEIDGDFDDLYQNDDSCDAECCKCSQGREHEKRSGPWTLLRCQCCGHSARHRKCINGDEYHREYMCSNCDVSNNIENDDGTVRTDQSATNEECQPSNRQPVCKPLPTPTVNLNSDGVILRSRRKNLNQSLDILHILNSDCDDDDDVRLSSISLHRRQSNTRVTNDVTSTPRSSRNTGRLKSMRQKHTTRTRVLTRQSPRRPGRTRQQTHKSTINSYLFDDLMDFLDKQRSPRTTSR